MKAEPRFEIFLSAPPGLELVLKAEALEAGFRKAKAVPGGVVFRGTWPDVWRANLELRGAGRVLARIGRFRSTHLAHLDRTLRAFDWTQYLRADAPVRVEASSARSRIYHQGAAAERLANALRDGPGITVSDSAELRVMLRIEADICTLSLDTSGTALHKRGFKQVMGKAPMRETLAALFLRQCGFDGTEPLCDPMCGSGTFVIEAAEWALGLRPGRARSFTFEQLATFDPDTWAEMAADTAAPGPSPLRFHGGDRDAGAVRGAKANAERAGVGAVTSFICQPLGALTRPDGPAGLVIVNPPYGDRIGDARALFPLYATLGRVLQERFSGWRVGLITTRPDLARATALPFEPPTTPTDHGGLKIRLWQSGPLS